MSTLKRVVVTGTGAISPLGNSGEESWNALLSGKSSAAPITRFNADKFKTRIACEVKNFFPADHLDKKTIRTTDRFTRYALIAGQEAWEMAGLQHEKLNKRRCGIIWASGNGGVETFEEEVRDYYLQDQQPRFNPYMIPKTLADTPSGMLALRFGFQGVNFAAIAACAASNAAIVQAMQQIRWGKADLIICGGSEAPVTPAWIGGFSAMKALSVRNDSPSTASRPLDADRDGFVVGEGAAALVLESYEHAIARGAKIYAEVLGGGISADAYHPVSAHPNGEGAAICMEDALEDAGLSPKQISYINLHATSTILGDLSEITAMEKVFGANLDSIRLVATKSATGHLLGAAAALEAVFCIKSLETGIIPPNINLFRPDPALPANLRLPLHTELLPEPKYVLSNSFGFGGHNAAVVFGNYSGS